MNAPTGDPGDLRARAEAWLAEDPDPITREELRALLDGTADGAAGGAAVEAELRDRFAGHLTFGTAGLRGELGAGPNRMNLAVVRRATAGLAGYLVDSGRVRADGRAGGAPVVVGYDARHGSAAFARDAAAVFAGFGITTLVLPRPLPTPVLAFAVRHLGAAAGVMVTASHNPPADNGYKVYLGGPDGGAQIAPPVDRDIEARIAAVGPLAGVPLGGGVRVLGDEIVSAYLAALDGLPLGGPRALTVVYTPLHGVGRDVLLEAFRLAGFTRPLVVAEQAEPDPDFPTVAFPNPEEPGALDLAMALARREGADLVIANDPDADRCAVACGGRILRGDEVGVLLADAWLRRGRGGTYATTVVSSSMLRAMCAARGVDYAETLTGFKWIVRAAPEGALAFGYEEALGYAVAPRVVRDKDGISAALVVADLAARLRAEGRTLLDRLDDLAREHGLHATEQLSVRVDDPAVIAAAMTRLRSSPPAALMQRPVTSVEDRAPEVDVLTVRAGGVRVVVRPSGTEPKLKAYLEVVVPVGDGDVGAARARAATQLDVLRLEVAALLGL